MSTAPNNDGWLAGARHCPSPNFNERPAGCSPLMLVVHNISLPPGRFGGGRIEALFCNALDCDEHPFFDELRGLEVSAHFLIDRDGLLTQFVSCDDRAWHAGVSRWGGRENCNDFSIGVELEGTDTTPYTEEQYDTLRQLVAELRRRYPALSAGPGLGHSDIAPGRKTDPGAAFDWRRLRLMLREEPLPSDGSCTA